MKGLQNKRVFITGAASGIGRATAERFYAEGSELVLVDMPTLEQAELQSLFPNRMTYISGDVTKSETLDAIKAEMTKGVDVLINNAGITKDATLLKMTDEQWDAVIAVNLTSIFKLSKAAAEVMKAAGKGGSIIMLLQLLLITETLVKQITQQQKQVSLPWPKRWLKN